MIENAENTDYPQDQTQPTEPMRCTACGNLLGYFSGRSDADLVLRCPKCSADLDVHLREGASSYKRRNKRKSPVPKGN